jgi:hypothetical protein
MPARGWYAWPAREAGLSLFSNPSRPLREHLISNFC